MAPGTPLPHLDETRAATTRYLEALTVLDDEALRAPSLLPGWSRGHVVSHVSRNADALRNLFDWALSGVPSPMYESAEQRDADIDSGAAGTPEEIRADAARSAALWEQRAAALTTEHWDAEVSRTRDSDPFHARAIPLLRRIEVEVHHADLGAGYTSHDWPVDFTTKILDRVQNDRAAGPAMVLSSTDVDGLWKYGVQGQGPEIKGAAADLAWWVLGRGDGSGLVSSAGVLPRIGGWR